MNEPRFYYVTIIDAPREMVWRALTTGAFTKQYWHNTDVRSSWRVGDAVEFYVKAEEGEVVGCAGEVLVADEPSNLSYTWHFPLNPACKGEQPSRVTFELTDVGGATKLVVTHDQFEGETATYEMVSGGWPFVLSGLKTLCEAGKTRDFSMLEAG